MKNLLNILKPENELEKQIIKDPEFLEGALWGKVRHGHPEGQVYLHILEVFDNIEKYANNQEDRQKLRLIALVHDTFKFRVNTNKPRVGENHHAYFAYKFAQKFIDDKEILQIILEHDEVYHYWLKAHRSGDWSKAEYKLSQLENKIYNLELYRQFYICDALTGDKRNEPYQWFINKEKAYEE